MGIETRAICWQQVPGFNSGMDRTPLPHANTSARLSAALEHADAGLAEPGDAWLAVVANRGMWAAWLHWILRLLALEFALACGEASQHVDAPDCGSGAWHGNWPPALALAGADRQLPRRVLDRKIDRLLETAARLWACGDQPAARPRRRRRPLLDRVRCIGRRLHIGWACVSANSGFIGARVLALRKPRPSRNGQCPDRQGWDA
jgi:hypothetical protein